MVTAIGLLELAAALREVRHPVTFLGGLDLGLTIESMQNHLPFDTNPAPVPAELQGCIRICAVKAVASLLAPVGAHPTDVEISTRTRFGRHVLLDVLSWMNLVE